MFAANSRPGGKRGRALTFPAHQLWPAQIPAAAAWLQVARLAERWGARHSGEGRVIWAEQAFPGRGSSELRPVTADLRPQREEITRGLLGARSTLSR